MAGMKGGKKKHDKKGEKGFLVLQGPLTLARGCEIKNGIEKALGSGGEVEIQFGDVPEADLSFLQTLCAASRSAAERGLKLNVRDEELPEVLVGIIEVSGFANHRGCPQEGCLWPGSRVRCKGEQPNE